MMHGAVAAHIPHLLQLPSFFTHIYYICDDLSNFEVDFVVLLFLIIKNNYCLCKRGREGGREGGSREGGRKG